MNKLKSKTNYVLTKKSIYNKQVLTEEDKPKKDIFYDIDRNINEVFYVVVFILFLFVISGV